MSHPLSRSAEKVLAALKGVRMPTADWNAGMGPLAQAAAVICALVDECACTVRYHPENSELNEMAIDASEALAIAAELDAAAERAPGTLLPAAPPHGSSDEQLETLIPSLLEMAIHAANTNHPEAAGKLTLAAQLLGKRL